MTTAIERDKITEVEDLTAEEILSEFESHIIRGDDFEEDYGGELNKKNIINKSSVTNLDKIEADVRFERTISICENENEIQLSWPQYAEDTIHVDKKERFNVVPQKIIDKYDLIGDGILGWGNPDPIEKIRYRDKEGKQPATCGDCDGEGCDICDWSGDVVTIAEGTIEWYCTERVYVDDELDFDISKLIGVPKTDIRVSGNCIDLTNREQFSEMIKCGNINIKTNRGDGNITDAKDYSKTNIGYPVVEAEINMKVSVAKLEYTHGGKLYDIHVYNEYMIFSNIPELDATPNSRVGIALLILLVSLFFVGPFYPILQSIL